MSWISVGATAVSVVGGALSKNASKQGSVSGTSGFCACVQAGTKQAIQTAEGIANQPFQGFCACIAVAGLTPNQLAAQSAAGGLGQYLPGYESTAAQTFNPQTIAQYSSPYISQVLNAQNALATRNYQTEQAALSTKQGMTNAFGGDRSAIAGNELTTAFNLQSDVRNAQGLQGAYQAGVSAFNQDRAFASGQVGQGLGALSSTGCVAQRTAQNRGNFLYNQFCQQRNWQKGQNAYLTQTLAQVPKGQYYTGNQSSTTIPAGGGWGGALAGGAAIAMAGRGAFGGGGGGGYTGGCVGSGYCAAAQRGSPALCNGSIGARYGCGLSSVTGCNTPVGQLPFCS